MIGCSVEKQIGGEIMVDVGRLVKGNYSNLVKRLWWFVNGSSSGQ